jgi:rare lipoprotein A
MPLHRILLLVGLAALPACSTVPQQPRKAALYDPRPTYVQEGIASWYGGRWIGRLTANGERYRAADMTAAHKKLPFNSKVRVIDLKTGKSVIVRINNRGPFIRGRIIDLSVAAAKQLGTYERGIAKVRIEVLKEIPILTKPNLRVTSTTPENPRRVAATTASPATIN